MNAQSKITPARDRYIPIVQHHRGGCEGKELELRCSILLMRDKAAASLNSCSDDAAGALTEVVRLATLYAYRSMLIEELENLRYRLLQLTTCASGLEMFAYRLAGGTDAGG